MNNCIFTGRLTADPDLRATQDGKYVANMTLAVDHGYGDKKTTSFFELTAWGNQAESISKYTSKGSKIAVSCAAKQEKWEDKNGNKRSAVKFVVNAWEFFESKKEQKPTPKPGDDEFLSIPTGIDEELPFN